MRYTRADIEQDKLYLPSTAVVMSEVIKSIVCLVLLYLAPEGKKRSFSRLSSTLNRELILNWRETIKLAFPAILYLIQNNLQYVAASNLDAATFQVTYQLKILTTAFFSVVILKKNLSKLKWIALAILTVGIALVVLPKDASTAFMAYITGNTVADTSSTPNISTGNQSNIHGFLAVLTACFLSGLAGVYFEKILKGPSTPAPKPINTSEEMADDEEAKKVNLMDDEDDEAVNASNQIWVRNIQMSFFSVLLGLVFVVMIQDGKTIVQKGFFVNYNVLTWIVILIQALGGLIVALVVKYADNILKGFATSISIILSSIMSAWLFHFAFSGSFLLGATMVIYATYLYGF
ncbi:UDP-galactose transporter [Pilobolus umbonatus]|nr:UDP-galactose transporter [Pilobolus umbonatus]